MKCISFVAVLALLALAVTSAADTMILKVLSVTVPDGYDPAKATVLLGQYDSGLSLKKLKRDGRTSDFKIVMGEATESAKLLAYYPGCKFFTLEIPKEKLGQRIEAKFEKLPTVALNVQFTGSDDQPIIGQGISFGRVPVDMAFFGYLEGPMLSDDSAPDAFSRSGAKGMLKVALPDLTRDPLYAKLKLEAGFVPRLIGSPHAGVTGFDLVPGWIKAQQKYKDTQIKVVFRGRIRGKVIPQYLANRGVEAKIGPDDKKNYSVWFEADRVGGSGGQGRGIEADGTFSMALPAGKYDLSIQVRDDKGVVTKSLPIAKDYYIGENDDKFLDIKD